MKVFISILFNALILFSIGFLMPDGVEATGGIQLWFIGGIILGILNYVVRPILKLIGLPFLLITFGLFIFVINGVILYLLQNIIAALSIEGVSFSIHGFGNFVIAVAIFSVFNTIYNTFLKKINLT